jgi:SAM-dependent methyltransferase
MFDDFADAYEAMIDWPKRLANEEPFYRRLFARLGVASLIDVACGTGDHAAMFHSWGLKVDGADLSPAMIERARRRFGEPQGLRWAVRGYDEPVEPAGAFDVAICVGNSLALAPDMTTAERAIRQMLAAVRDGGAIVVQILNLWRLPDGPCVWQKSRRVALPPAVPGAAVGGTQPLFADKGLHAVDHLPSVSPVPAASSADALILKGVHRCGNRGYVDLIVTDLAGNAAMRSESTRLLGLEAAELDRMAKAVGAKKITIFGGYQDQPYEPQKSVDMVMVADK